MSIIIIIIIITDDGGWRRLHRGDRLRSESSGRQKCALVDIFFFLQISVIAADVT